MIKHIEISKEELRNLIVKKTILFGGNTKPGIYGTLSCTPGKRMKRENRVFFTSAAEAAALGYRPCGHCLKEDYKNWKNGTV